jgi:hypothetical protein
MLHFESANDISAEAMAKPRESDGKAQLGDQPGLLRMHHRLWADFQD